MRPEEINWRTPTTEHERTHALPIWRAPATGRLNLVITGENLWGVRTHWWQGRTQPHLEENCEACAAKRPWRWAGWLSCWQPGNNQRGILHITASAVEVVEEYHKQNGTLRGAKISIGRPSGRKNGRVQAVITHAGLVASQIPPACDVQAVLLKIWEAREDQKVPDLAPEPLLTNRINRTADDQIDALRSRYQSGNGQPAH